jgi:hypothetical protein
MAERPSSAAERSDLVGQAIRLEALTVGREAWQGEECCEAETP